MHFRLEQFAITATTRHLDALLRQLHARRLLQPHVADACAAKAAATGHRSLARWLLDLEWQAAPAAALPRAAAPAAPPPQLSAATTAQAAPSAHSGQSSHSGQQSQPGAGPAHAPQANLQGAFNMTAAARQHSVGTAQQRAPSHGSQGPLAAAAAQRASPAGGRQPPAPAPGRPGPGSSLNSQEDDELETDEDKMGEVGEGEEDSEGLASDDDDDDSQEGLPHFRGPHFMQRPASSVREAGPQNSKAQPAGSRGASATTTASGPPAAAAGRAASSQRPEEDDGGPAAAAALRELAAERERLAALQRELQVRLPQGLR